MRFLLFDICINKKYLYYEYFLYFVKKFLYELDRNTINAFFEKILI